MGKQPDAPVDATEDRQASRPESDLLPVRMLNEYVYCPRLFYLMHVDGRWDDNAHTAEGRHVHRRVDRDRKSTRLNSSHIPLSRMPSSA